VRRPGGVRGFLAAGLQVGLLTAGCETKTPSGPTGNTPTTSTTTTTVAPTTPLTTSSSSTTTTTIVLGSLTRRYTTFQAPPNVPSDMTLFFELIPSGFASLPAASSTRRRVFGVTENEYRVTGVFVMGNGTAGTVSGELGEALNPLETGGEFEGSLTATTPSGCTGARDFSGRITNTTLQWNGGSTKPTSNACGLLRCR